MKLKIKLHKEYQYVVQWDEEITLHKASSSSSLSHRFVIFCYSSPIDPHIHVKYPKLKNSLYNILHFLKERTKNHNYITVKDIETGRIYTSAEFIEMYKELYHIHTDHQWTQDQVDLLELEDIID